MAQLDDLYTALKNADAAGDTAGAQKLAAYIKAIPSPDAGAAALRASNPGEYDPSSSQYQEKYGPTSVMSGTEKFVAGYGSAIPNMVRGIGQRLGLVSQADADEAKRLDAPLMNTGAGLAGNVVGNIAAAIPAVAIPGAGSVTGAAAIGAGLGAIQPTATGDSSKVLGFNVRSPVVANALTGAGLGGASVVGGRALGAAWQGGKALVEPFTDAGRTRIAGRMIQRFADDPNSIATATNSPTITGALPTLAEQTGDAGLARLQDSLRSVDPQINNQIAARLSDNNAARVGKLQDLAGIDGARDFAVANRAGTAQPMYEDAFAVKPTMPNNSYGASATTLPPGAQSLTADQVSKMQSLLGRPAIQDAMAAAQSNAANRGANVAATEAPGSIEGMHQMKLAMDDAISKLQNGTSAQVNKAAGIKSAQKDLVSLMESISPEYANARGVYRDMSQPINQMDIASNLLQRGASKTTDLAGNPLLHRNALMSALSDEPALIQRATGRNLGGSLSDVMEPGQLNMLRAIANETDRAGAVATAGNGPGSATAQRMASQNILRQIIGPTGLPASWAESALANTVVGKPFNLLYGGVAEPRIQQALAQAVLNPDQARAALAAAQAPSFQLPQNALTRVANQARRLVGVSTANSTRRP